MAGLRRRYGPQRGVRSGSFRPSVGLRGHLPRPHSIIGGQLKGAASQFAIPGVNVHIFPRMGMVQFDRSVIKSNWRAINRNPMQRAGNLVRMRARGSIRRVRRGAPPAPPGTPPRSRWGGKAKRAYRGPSPPFKQIYNLPLHMGTGQIIGMVGYNINPSNEMPVPGLHEHGGRARRSIYNPARRVQRQRRNRLGQWMPKIGSARIMATVRYPKRRFMWPALMYTRHKIPNLWRNSLVRASHRGRGMM